MTDEQEKLLGIYREGWAKLSAAEAAKADIERYIRELQRDQRAIANKIAALGLADSKPVRVCISCEQPQGQPHLPTCVTMTGTLARAGGSLLPGYTIHQLDEQQGRKAYETGAS